MRRLDLKVGYACNLRCRHCVQGNKRELFPSKSIEQIKSDLKEVFSKGVVEVVFTGGEPTVHKNILEAVKFARDLGFKLIQIQTNGRMFSSKNFTEKMVEAGMTEFSPALNGHIPSLHDYLASVPGAWKQTVRGIMNVKEYGLNIISNSVVSKPNYRFLNKLATLLVKLGVDQYQLAFVHAGGRAWENFDSIVPRVSLAAPHIHRGLQIGIDAGLPVMAEAMPYCLMRNYEKYVSELYIPSSAVYEVGFRTENYEKWRVNEGKWKGERCKSCAFFNICEGPWKEYVERIGPEEFIPIPGKKKTKADILGFNSKDNFTK